MAEYSEAVNKRMKIINKINILYNEFCNISEKCFLIFSGVFIGILFGLGYQEWKPLVRFIQQDSSNITDWIITFCTIGILMGTWVAAHNAKKAAIYAKEQNDQALANQLDELKGTLGQDLLWINNEISLLKKMLEYIESSLSSNSSYYMKRGEYKVLLSLFDNILDNKKLEKLYKNELFIFHVVGYSNLWLLTNCISSLTEARYSLYFDEKTSESDIGLDTGYLIEFYFIETKGYIKNTKEKLDNYCNYIMDFRDTIDSRYIDLVKQISCK